MDSERLGWALQIATPEQRSALEMSISSMVNLIIDNYERKASSLQTGNGLSIESSNGSNSQLKTSHLVSNGSSIHGSPTQTNNNGALIQISNVSNSHLKNSHRLSNGSSIHGSHKNGALMQTSNGSNSQLKTSHHVSSGLSIHGSAIQTSDNGASMQSSNGSNSQLKASHRVSNGSLTQTNNNGALLQISNGSSSHLKTSHRVSNGSSIHGSPIQTNNNGALKTSHHVSTELPTQSSSILQDFKKDENRRNLKLTQIENSCNYFAEDGFVYSPNNSNKHQNMYLRCKYSNQHKCKARVIVKNGIATLTKKHIHLASKTDLCKSKLDKNMDKICQENKFLTAREAYFQARENIDIDEVMYAPDRKSYGPFVHRRKKQNEPKIPYSFEEFEEFINDERYRDRYSFDQRNQTFYRGVYKTRNGHSMIVFISESGLKHLMEMDDIELLMDGTFKILPRHIKFAQLYIMSFMYEDRAYPFAFVFMQKRDTASYDLLFDVLKSLFTPNVASKVVKCMTDYEKAVRKALKAHFPNARISGCFFHFVKAINKSAKKFGLSKDERFAKAVQEVSCIALLPNNFVSDGFDYVDKKIKKSVESNRWNRFSLYFNRQWRNANVSVYGLRHRSNNFLESLNKSSNLLSGRLHQNIWSVLRTIKQIEMDKTDELLEHKGGKMFKPKQNKKMIELNQKILDATLKFEETQDVGRFLRNVSYRSDILLNCKDEEHDDAEDDDAEDDDAEDDDDCDDEDEDFIPNDYDESCNFVRNDAKFRYADFFKRNDTILKRNATNDKQESVSQKKIKLFA